MPVEVVDVIEESEVVVDLQDDGRRGASEGDEVYSLDPQASLGLEHGS